MCKSLPTCDLDSNNTLDYWGSFSTLEIRLPREADFRPFLNYLGFNLKRILNKIKIVIRFFNFLCNF